MPVIGGGGGTGYTFWDIGGCNCNCCYPCPFPARDLTLTWSPGYMGTGGGLSSMVYDGSAAPNLLTWRGACQAGGFGTSFNWQLRCDCVNHCVALDSQHYSSSTCLYSTLTTNTAWDYPLHCSGYIGGATDVLHLSHVNGTLSCSPLYVEWANSGETITFALTL